MKNLHCTEYSGLSKSVFHRTCMANLGGWAMGHYSFQVYVVFGINFTKGKAVSSTDAKMCR